MNEMLSSNSTAILLLTAPLLGGRGDTSSELLTSGEYSRLARLLRDNHRQPSDLLGPDSEGAIELCSRLIVRERLKALLGRGFLLSQALERWSARSIWVASRADTYYPRRIKARLKEEAPPVLYGCGDSTILETGGMAVVGSRHVDEELIDYSANVGRMAASTCCTLVSGGARGVDQAAMYGALDAGGTAVGVLADSLERVALSRSNREHLMSRRLLLVSPFDPAAGFNVGHAMKRNKYIYALSDVALVVNSDYEKGGTWAGAIEQLERLHYVPLFVRNGSKAGKGNLELLKRGARLWPDPKDVRELGESLASAIADFAHTQNNNFSLPDLLQSAMSTVIPPMELSQRFETVPPTQNAAYVDGRIQPAESVFQTVRDILCSELVDGSSEAEVADLLGVLKPQAKIWLMRLVELGDLELLSKPTRFRVRRK